MLPETQDVFGQLAPAQVEQPFTKWFVEITVFNKLSNWHFLLDLLPLLSFIPVLPAVRYISCHNMKAFFVAIATLSAGAAALWDAPYETGTGKLPVLLPERRSNVARTSTQHRKCPKYLFALPRRYGGRMKLIENSGLNSTVLQPTDIYPISKERTYQTVPTEVVS